MTEPRVRRRLSAILAADVVGFSSLMGRGEAHALSLVMAARTGVLEPRITGFGGRVFKTTGDGILAEFPSVVDAVACAVDIQAALGTRNSKLPEGDRLSIRIGVNLGDVIIEGEDVFGDGVNVAVRLEGIANAGGVAISGTVRDHLGNRLDLRFEDMGEQTLKNIQAPVRVFAIRPGASAPHVQTPAPSQDRPSIAVLPFQNMSGDAEQDYFSDGVAEDIITALSRFNSLLVVARNSSFAYKARAVDIRQVGKELGVRYVLEGSVRRSGNRLRITGQLIEATTGSHLWADKFDGLVEDVFALQDQVTASVVGAIAPKVELAEIQRARRKPTESMSAYDHYLRGVELLRGNSAVSNKQAREEFERAVQLDPQFALASAYLALALLVEHRYGLAGQEIKDKALACARTALDLDPGEARCHQFLAQVYRFRGNFDLAIAHFKRAIDINPNDANGLALFGSLLGVAGQPAEGVALIRRAMKINPLHPEWYWNQLAVALYADRQYEESISANQHGERPGQFWYLARMAACHSQLGRTDQARALVAEVLRRKPDFRYSTVDLSFRNPEDAEHVIDGFRKAGLPE
jgi:adenylate cyclase